MKNRIAWIDAAKGIGIFLVVLGHALPESHVAATIIWTFHMPLFFFLSGLTGRPWAPGTSTTIANGLKNLAVPYLFFSLIAILLFLSLKGDVTSIVSWRNLAGQMVYGVSGNERKMLYDVALWFFTCLFSTRILFILITALSPGLRTTLIAAVLLACFAHMYVLVYFTSMLWNFDIALVALLFYTSGFGVSQTMLRQTSAPPVPRGGAGVAGVLISLGLVLAVALLNGRIDMNGRGFGNILYFYTGAYAGIYLMIALSVSASRIKWIGTMGKAAIVIFPVHGLWESLPYRLLPVIKWYGFRITHSELAGALMAATLQVLLCMPVYFLLKRFAPQFIGLSKQRAAPSPLRDPASTLS